MGDSLFGVIIAILCWLLAGALVYIAVSAYTYATVTPSHADYGRMCDDLGGIVIHTPRSERLCLNRDALIEVGQ